MRQHTNVIAENATELEGNGSISSADKHIKTMLNYHINEEKDKAKRHLNIIIHNIPKSASEGGNTRKKHYTDFVTDICQQHLNTEVMKISINKCFCIGKRGAKLRLLRFQIRESQNTA